MPFVFSPSMLTFYDAGNMAAYLAAGTWPSDPVPVSDDTVSMFIAIPPDGFILGADGNGQPAWVPKPPPPPLTRGEIAANATDAGMTLQSIAHPELNKTWALDSVTQRDIQGLALGIGVGFGFPNKQPVFGYYTKHGEQVPLTSETVVVLYNAMVLYVLALRMYESGQTDDLPPNPFPVP
jgi:hypothetical protein